MKSEFMYKTFQVFRCVNSEQRFLSRCKSLQRSVAPRRCLLGGYWALRARLNYTLYATQRCERRCGATTAILMSVVPHRMQETSGMEGRNGGWRSKTK